jgi:hypothetical protein
MATGTWESAISATASVPIGVSVRKKSTGFVDTAHRSSPSEA